MKKGKLNIIFGGQAGSEGKGKMAAYLVDKFDIKFVAGSLSPNAGHTVVRNGKKHVTHHIPCGVWGARDLSQMSIFLGPASIINPNILDMEIDELMLNGFNTNKLFIDPRANILTAYHITDERDRGITRIGSTSQGVGAARCTKIMRVDAIRAINVPLLQPYTSYGISDGIMDLLETGETVLYEMGQGFDLCMEHGVDPVYCTSRIVNPMEGLAEIGIPNKWLGDVYAVIRTFPIRVNNRDGTSGPYPSRELMWEEVTKRAGAPHDLTEITTTTKLPRRVFEFSLPQIHNMIRTCDPTFLCVQFANYLDWGCYRKTDLWSLGGKVAGFMDQLAEETGVQVAYAGTGPNHEDMVDTGEDRRVEKESPMKGSLFTRGGVE